MPRSKIPQGRRGLSLAEILIAAAVAAFALLALASVTIGVIRADKYAKYQSFATTMARQELEHVAGDGAYMFKLLGYRPDQQPSFDVDLEVEKGTLVRFHQNLRVNYMPDSESRYSQVTSEVSWTQQGHARSLQLQTMCAVPLEPPPATLPLP